MPYLILKETATTDILAYICCCWNTNVAAGILLLFLAYYNYFANVKRCLLAACSPDCLSPPQQLYTLTLSQAKEEKEGEEGGRGGEQ